MPILLVVYYYLKMGLSFIWRSYFVHDQELVVSLHHACRSIILPRNHFTCLILVIYLHGNMLDLWNRLSQVHSVVIMSSLDSGNLDDIWETNKVPSVCPPPPFVTLLCLDNILLISIYKRTTNSS